MKKIKQTKNSPAFFQMNCYCLRFQYINKIDK